MRTRYVITWGWAPLAVLLMGGCSWTDQSGTHHLIVGIGFGIITSTNRCGVEVRDSRVLGGEISGDGVGVGWMRHHRVEIDPARASNVVTSIKANPLGLTVKNFDPYARETRQTNRTNERKPLK